MSGMSGDMKRVMLLIDDKSTLEEVTRRAPPSLRGELSEIMQQFLDAELIRDKAKPVANVKTVPPKMASPKMAMPKAAAMGDELDFTSMAAPVAPADEAARKAAEQAQAARAFDELEAAVAAAKLKASAEAEAKAMAKAKLEAESIARAKAEAEAEARARLEAEEKQLAEAKVRHEMEARVRAEQEAARAKAELEAARAFAAQEAAKAKALAEERARQEAEVARLKAEHDAALLKAEEEERARQAAEHARIKAEQEAERIRAEQEAARIKAAQEAERARAEQEAARIKAAQEAERVRAEQEAARVQAEQEAARIKAEQEAERVRAEQEAVRVKAEQEAARVKAEEEAAKIRAEEEAKALAAERARAEAEAARLKAEQEAIRLREQQEEAARAQAALELQARQAAEAARLKAEQEEAIRQALAAKLQAEEQSKHDAQIFNQAILHTTTAAPSAADLPAFKIDLDSLNLSTAPTPTPAPATSPQAEPVAQVAVEQYENIAAPAQAVQQAAEEQPAKQNAAEEMARMKAEQEAARQRAEQEARAGEEAQALAEEQAAIWAEAEQRANLQAKLDAEQAAQHAAIAQAKAVQKQVVRERRKPLPLGKIFLGLIALSLVVAVALPYVWPLQKYVAAMEQMLSAQLKQPVHIGAMSAATFPPRLKLQNITVGIENELKVGTAVLDFDPATVFSKSKTVKDAELQAVVLEGRNLEQVAGWLKGMGGNAQYTLRHLTIQSLQLNAEGISLPSLKGDAELEQGAFTRVVLHSDDEKMSVELLPVQNRWQVSFGIRESALPVLPGVMFSDFSAKGDIGEGEVDFSEIAAHAYAGVLSGNGKLSWSKGWQAQGHIQAKEMDLEKLFEKVGTSSEVLIEGTFSMQADKLSQLGQAPHLEGTFGAKDGVIHAMDMAETARLLSREHLPGGRTPFNELTGNVLLDNHALRFTQIRITSDKLSANGTLDISATSQLNGNFNAVIKEEAGNNPLVLSGTLLEPKLRAK